MSKLDHTLVATWTTPGIGNAAAKTVTGCTVGQPIFFIHQQPNSTGACYYYIKATSGAAQANNNSGHFFLGTGDGSGVSGVPVFAVVPNATTVGVEIIHPGFLPDVAGGTRMTNAGNILVYKT